MTDNKTKSRVAVIPCDSYDDEQVFTAVKQGVALLGGIEKFVQQDEKILLKPNLLNRADPDKAVTTHPTVFSAVARLFQDAGFKNLSYGDSPGHPGSPKRTAEICGIAQIAEQRNIPMADFQGCTAKEYTRGRLTRKYEICNGVLEADAIINICKMKTHQLERITGGVKNLFGCVQGLNKSASHAKFPDAHSFAQMLIELNLLLKPRLHIMDGIIAMEGNGPMSGTPIPMNVLLISDDPVAMDAVFCKLIDLDPKDVPTVYYGEKLGLGHYKADDIEILGVPLLDVYIKPEFDVEREGQRAKKWKVIRKLKFLTKKPVILHDKCVKCGACVEVCPVSEKAVYFENGDTTKPPVFQYKRCIRCYCCQEMCPAQSIIVKRKIFG